MWILLVFLAFIALFVLAASISSKKHEREKELREEKRIREEEITYNEVISESKTMLKLQRFHQMLDDIIEIINKNKDNLIEVYVGDHTVRLKKNDKDMGKYTLPIPGEEITIRTGRYNIYLSTAIENAALCYLIMTRCPYLAYSYEKKVKDESNWRGYRIVTRKGRDLREAMFDTVDSYGDPLGVVYQKILYKI